MPPARQQQRAVEPSNASMNATSRPAGAGRVHLEPGRHAGLGRVDDRASRCRRVRRRATATPSCLGDQRHEERPRSCRPRRTAAAATPAASTPGHASTARRHVGDRRLSCLGQPGLALEHHEARDRLDGDELAPPRSRPGSTRPSRQERRVVVLLHLRELALERAADTAGQEGDDRDGDHREERHPSRQHPSGVPRVGLRRIRYLGISHVGGSSRGTVEPDPSAARGQRWSHLSTPVLGGDGNPESSLTGCRSSLAVSGGSRRAVPARVVERHYHPITRADLGHLGTPSSTMPMGS